MCLVFSLAGTKDQLKMFFPTDVLVRKGKFGVVW